LQPDWREQALFPEIVNLHNLSMVAMLDAGVALVTAWGLSAGGLQGMAKAEKKTKQTPHEVLIFCSHVRTALRMQL
jgi:hypothetical protein